MEVLENANMETKTPPPPPKVDNSNQIVNKEMYDTDHTDKDPTIGNSRKVPGNSIITTVCKNAVEHRYQTPETHCKADYSYARVNMKFIDRNLDSIYDPMFSNKYQAQKAHYKQRSLLHEVLFRLNNHMAANILMVHKMCETGIASNDMQLLYRKIRYNLNLTHLQIPSIFAPELQMLSDYTPEDPNLSDTVYLTIYDDYVDHPNLAADQYLLAGENKFLESDIHGMMAQIQRLQTTPANNPNGNYSVKWNHTDHTAQAPQYIIGGQVNDIRGKLDPLIPGQTFVYRDEMRGDPSENDYQQAHNWTTHQRSLINYYKRFNFPAIQANVDFNSIANQLYLHETTTWVQYLNSELQAIIFTDAASGTAYNLAQFTNTQLVWDIEYKPEPLNEVLDRMRINLTLNEALEANHIINFANMVHFIDNDVLPAANAAAQLVPPVNHGLEQEHVNMCNQVLLPIADQLAGVQIQVQNAQSSVTYAHYNILREFMDLPAVPDLDVSYLIAADIRDNHPSKYWDDLRYVTYFSTKHFEELAQLVTYQHIMPPVGSNYSRATTSTRRGLYYNREHMPVRAYYPGEHEYANFFAAVRPFYSKIRC